MTTEQKFLDSLTIAYTIDAGIIEIRDNQGIVLCNKCNSDQVRSHYDSFGVGFQCHKCGERMYDCNYRNKTHKPELTRKDIPRIVEEIFPKILHGDLYAFIQHTLPVINFKEVKRLATKKVKERFNIYLKKLEK
jgi:ribosomal protein L37AE/L43A